MIQVKNILSKYVLFYLVDKLLTYEYLCDVKEKGSIRSPPSGKSFSQMFAPVRLWTHVSYGDKIHKMCQKLQSAQSSDQEESKTTDSAVKTTKKSKAQPKPETPTESEKPSVEPTKTPKQPKTSKQPKAQK